MYGGIVRGVCVLLLFGLPFLGCAFREVRIKVHRGCYDTTGEGKIRRGAIVVFWERRRLLRNTMLVSWFGQGLDIPNPENSEQGERRDMGIHDCILEAGRTLNGDYTIAFAIQGHYTFFFLCPRTIGSFSRYIARLWQYNIFTPLLVHIYSIEIVSNNALSELQISM